MMYATIAGTPISATLLDNYFQTLVNMFFKILPLWEARETSLAVYLKSLQAELLGCNEFVVAVHNDSLLLSLLSILQYLIDTPECEVAFVKREVFHAISICNKLKAKYAAQNTQAVI